MNRGKILGIIPARGGSKGIPRKNLFPVMGKPLIEYTISAAHHSKLIDRTIVSTDDSEIRENAIRLGCDVPFLRPAELARDDTPGIDPVFHAMNQLPEFEWIVLLQPTSPLRTSEDIDRCIELALTRRVSSVSVCAVTENPFHMFFGDPDGKLRSVLPAEMRPARRQDCPPIYRLNGAIYVANRDSISRNHSLMDSDTIGYVMPRERSIDIDEEEDIRVVERFLASSSKG